MLAYLTCALDVDIEHRHLALCRHLIQAAAARTVEVVVDGGRFDKGILVAQIAISFVLLLAAGLFVGTLRNVLAVDPGFQAEGVLLVNVNVQRVAAERPRRLGV